MIILDPELNSDGLMRIEPYLYGKKNLIEEFLK